MQQPQEAQAVSPHEGDGQCSPISGAILESGVSFLATTAGVPANDPGLPRQHGRFFKNMSINSTTLIVVIYSFMKNGYEYVGWVTT